MTKAAAMSYWFRCPACGNVMWIEDEQANGATITCDAEHCHWHGRGRVNPLIPTRRDLSPQQTMRFTPA